MLIQDLIVRHGYFIHWMSPFNVDHKLNSLLYLYLWFFTCVWEKGGGLDILTLDSLYDDAIRRSNQNVSYNPWEQPVPMASPMMSQTAHDPFFASNAMAAPPSVQMVSMANQQQAFMFQQQQQQMMMMAPQQQQPVNPFGNSYGAGIHPYGSGMPVQVYNPYNTGLI